MGHTGFQTSLKNNTLCNMLHIIVDLVNHLQGEPKFTKVSVNNEKSDFAASHFEETSLELFQRVAN